MLQSETQERSFIRLCVLRNATGKMQHGGFSGPQSIADVLLNTIPLFDAHHTKCHRS